MKARLRSRRYLKQIFIRIITALLILCIISSATMFIRSYYTATESIHTSEANRNENLLYHSNLYLEELRSTLTSFANFNIPYEELSSSDNYWTRFTFDTMITSHYAANPYINNIDIMMNKHSLSPSGIAHDRLLGNFFNIGIYTTEKVSWPYYFDVTNYFGNPFHTVTITLSGYYLSKQVFDFEDTNRLDYFLTENGTILLTNQKSAFFINIDELYPDMYSNLSVDSMGQVQTYGDYYYVFSKPDKYGFQVLSMIPKHFYSHQYTTILIQTLLMTVGLLFLTLLISFFLAERFYRPVNSMVTLLRTYIPDDLKDYENEIAFLHDNISKYIGKGKEAETMLPKTLVQLHNAQTAVLQYQLNSHFLFNTMENIKAISITELGSDNEIENCILLLNTIIREGVLQKTSVIPLSHEVHLSKCYLELMKIRFPKVSYHWSVDENLLHCQVFRFSLQPILENCFSHGFNGNTGRPKEIHIHICREDNNLVIYVKDNGFGIDKNSLDKIKQLLASKEEKDSQQHVGIWNVHKRITNIFGDQYGITIENTPPGVTVKTTYPITMPL